MKKIRRRSTGCPCAGFAEKDGTFVNSSRWLQWKNAALPPPGQAQAGPGHPRAASSSRCASCTRRRAASSPIPILNAHLDLHRSAAIRRSPRCARRSTARRSPTSPTRRPTRRSRPASSCPASRWLKDDGTTLCGNWLYCGSGPRPATRCARRGTDDPSGLGMYPNWAWSWPANRRVHVQPRVLRSRGQAVGSRAAAGLVERGAAEVGRQRRARLQGGLAARGPHGAVHHERRGRRPPLRAARGLRRRAVPGALRADREPGREPAPPEAVDQPGGQEVQHADRTSTATTGRRVQRRLHHLPADRALPLLDQEQPDERAAHARAVRRDPGGAGRRDWASRAASR